MISESTPFSTIKKMVTPYPVKELDEFSLSNGEVPDTVKISPIEPSVATRLQESPKNAFKISDKPQPENIFPKFSYNIRNKLNTLKKKCSSDPNDGSFIRVTTNVDPEHPSPAIGEDTSIIDVGSKVITRPKKPKKQERARSFERLRPAPVLLVKKPRLSVPTTINAKPFSPYVSKKDNQPVTKDLTPQCSPGLDYLNSSYQIPIVGLIFQSVDTIIDTRLTYLAPYRKYLKVALILLAIIEINVFADHLIGCVEKLTGLG